MISICLLAIAISFVVILLHSILLYLRLRLWTFLSIYRILLFYVFLTIQPTYGNITLTFSSFLPKFSIFTILILIFFISFVFILLKNVTSLIFFVVFVWLFIIYVIVSYDLTMSLVCYCFIMFLTINFRAKVRVEPVVGSNVV